MASATFWKRKRCEKKTGINTSQTDKTFKYKIIENK